MILDTTFLIDLASEIGAGVAGPADNWIAGFARYYGEPLVSNDQAFDRVHGLRRVPY